jgi:hypothetical protein
MTRDRNSNAKQSRTTARASRKAIFGMDSLEGRMLLTTGLVDSPITIIKLPKADYFTVSAPSQAVAGVSFPVTVTEHSLSGQVVTNDSGLTPALNIEVGGAYTSVGTVTLHNGTGTANVTISKPETVEALTAVTGSVLRRDLISGSSGPITVVPAPSSIALGTPATVAVGSAFTATITLENASGKTLNLSGNVQVGFSGGQGYSMINGIAPGSNSVTVQVTNGTGKFTVTPETASAFSLHVTGWNVSGHSASVSVTPDWFSNNLPDMEIQATAREFFDSSVWSTNYHTITFGNMLAILGVAESEMRSLIPLEQQNFFAAEAAENQILASLKALGTGGTAVNMPTYVQYLAKQVGSPDPNDVSFLASYYNKMATSAGGIDTVVIKGKPTFGESSGTNADAYVSEITALANQWFNGTVLPSTTVSGGADGVATPAYAPAGGYPSLFGGGTPVSLYGPSGEPLVTDVLQGQVGDCWFLSALAEVAYRDPMMIKNMIHTNGNGTYTVELWKLSGKNNVTETREFITVDDELPMLNGSPCFASTPNNVLWPAIFEKAAAELNGPGAAFSYQSLNGDGDSPPFSYPGGQTNPLDYYAGDAMYALMELAPQNAEITLHVLGDKASDIINDLNSKEFVILGTLPDNILGVSISVDPHLVTSHEYAVLSYSASTGDFLLYNPWGLANVANVTGNVSASATSIPVSTTAGITAGDVIQVGTEAMLVKSVGRGTLTVKRGYEGTTAAAIGQNTGIALNFEQGSPFQGTPLTASANENPGTPTYGLFEASGSFIHGNFADIENTTGPYSSAKPAQAGTPASLTTSQPAAPQPGRLAPVTIETKTPHSVLHINHPAGAQRGHFAWSRMHRGVHGLVPQTTSPADRAE